MTGCTVNVLAWWVSSFYKWSINWKAYFFHNYYS